MFLKKSNILWFISLVILFISAYIFFQQFRHVCDWSIEKTIPSPGKNIYAVVFLKNCGATASFITEIALDESPEKLKTEKSPNVFFRADSDHGVAPTQHNGELDIDIDWISHDEILISHHPLARVFKNDNYKNGIRINYTTINQINE